MKAMGVGLAAPLRQFTVTVGPDEPAALQECEWDPGEVSRWSLVSLAPASEYRAALAVEGRGVRVVVPSNAPASIEFFL